MKRYYECHITMNGIKDEIEGLVKAIGWTFSCINGDPDFGAGVKCYATKHFNERCGERDVINILDCAANSLSDYGAKVIRRKVELVVYDDRIKQ